jgi:hypothetical protein
MFFLVFVNIIYGLYYTCIFTSPIIHRLLYVVCCLLQLTCHNRLPENQRKGQFLGGRSVRIRTRPVHF